MMEVITGCYSHFLLDDDGAHVVPAHHVVSVMGAITVWELEESKVWWRSFVVPINPLRPRQNGRHFPDDIFKCIFLNENVWISIKVSLTFVPKGPINNIPALVQIMAWHWSGDEPLPEPMMVSLLTHICVTRPQWVNPLRPKQNGGNFADDIFKHIFSCFLNENCCILIKSFIEICSP